MTSCLNLNFGFMSSQVEQSFRNEHSQLASQSVFETILEIKLHQQYKMFDRRRVEGDPKRRLKLTWKRRKYANISILRLRVVVLSTFTQQKYFFASSLSSSCAAMLVLSIPTKSRKRLAHDVMYSCATIYRPCNDVNDSVKIAALAAVFLRHSNNSNNNNKNN